MNSMIESPLIELLTGSLPPAVLDAMLKGMILLSLVGLFALCLRKSSAAVRHGLWLAGLLGILLLPLLTTQLPDWKVVPRDWLPNADRTAGTIPAAKETTGPALDSSATSALLTSTFSLPASISGRGTEPVTPSAEVVSTTLSQTPVPSSSPRKTRLFRRVNGSPSSG